MGCGSSSRSVPTAACCSGAQNRDAKTGKRAGVPEGGLQGGARVQREGTHTDACSHGFMHPAPPKVKDVCAGSTAWRGLVASLLAVADLSAELAAVPQGRCVLLLVRVHSTL